VIYWEYRYANFTPKGVKAIAEGGLSDENVKMDTFDNV
jgi:hypothetical protein